MTMKRNQKNNVEEVNDGSDSQKTSFVFNCLKGSLVNIIQKDGSKIEGIFDTFDPKTKKISLKMASVARGDECNELATYSFPVDQLSSLKTENLNFAEITKSGGFATDSDISKGSAGYGRELTKWGEGIDGNGDGMSFEGDDLPPGTTWDQFETNKRLFGVVTSFDENVYTTSIDKSKPEYTNLMNQAERLAKEIEGKVSNNPHLAEERGLKYDDSQIDEEDRYGAVLRPDERPSNNENINAKSPISPVMLAKTTPAVSYRQAAAMNSSGGVKMPSNCTSATSPVNSINEKTSLVDDKQSVPPHKPRRSIVSVQADPKAIEEALTSVESSAQTINRRMSQVAEESIVTEKQRKEVFEKQKKDTANTFKAFSDQISTKLSPKIAKEDDSTNLDTCVSPGGTRLNPDAAEFVPTSSPAMYSSPYYGYYPTPPFNPYYNPYAYYDPTMTPSPPFIYPTPPYYQQQPTNTSPRYQSPEGKQDETVNGEP